MAKNVSFLIFVGHMLLLVLTTAGAEGGWHLIYFKKEVKMAFN